MDIENTNVIVDTSDFIKKFLDKMPQSDIEGLLKHFTSYFFKLVDEARREYKLDNPQTVNVVLNLGINILAVSLINAVENSVNGRETKEALLNFAFGQVKYIVDANLKQNDN